MEIVLLLNPSSSNAQWKRKKISLDKSRSKKSEPLWILNQAQ